MKRSTRSRTALPAAAVLTLALSACSAANEASTEPAASGSASEGGTATAVSGTLDGAGASSQQAAMQAWQAGFTGANPDATVNYDPAGSGAGREQFLAGAVDLAGSDAYLDDEELAAAQERCSGGTALDLPVYVSPIAVLYNLEGVDSLQLSPATIAGIFDQRITSWDDPAVAADNPGVTLPARPITPVNRADDSGTTENFTEYLAAAAPEAWPHEPDGEWPVAGGEAAQGTSGVVSAVGAGDGTIGYADASQAGDLGVATVRVGEEFVGPTPEAAAAVLDTASPVEGRPDGDIALEVDRATTESGVYPIVLASYHIACSTYEDAETADLVKAFLAYVVSEEGQQAAADNAGSAPISDDLRSQVESSIGMIAAAG
ncbi:phosphate ABC transporter substrate-binding protein PstS [Quadrisphaera sp. DSM 44207]|uniref:phosphate ABC transporter substrate-binding protein PstS n=1 Tax=Quadrisphaera sp. DSM 44207 TaxID=1881057 RepID=UPI000889A1F3|nr:phosphate ABC transporter substrate-binding protein PstS [Quadrisphaera sp. DSM 44207]SDQ84368.1 phosphate ABC transporter substrate-binding protein, PhoT family [Quadrisphaera sp. DSM 44207]